MDIKSRVVDFLVKKLENTCLYKAKTVGGGDSEEEDGLILIDDDRRYE
jgi:hypothetical protein